MTRFGTRLRQLPPYLAGRMLLAMLALMPRHLGRSLGRIIGAAFYLFSGQYRAVALRNLERALSEAGDPREARRIARAAFVHLGEIMFDAAYFRRLNRTPIERVARVEGLEHLRSAAADGRGILVFSGHFGHWELAAQIHNRLGFPMTMVVRPIDNPFIDRLFRKVREFAGNRVLSKHNAARGILRALREERSIALLIDQNVRGTAGVFVEFFGRLASTTPSLATLALKSRAPILPIFSYPLPDGRLLIRYLEPIRATRRGTLASDILDLTSRCTTLLEREIRGHPELWLWMHDRWKTRPPTAARPAPASLDGRENGCAVPAAGIGARRS